VTTRPEPGDRQSDPHGSERDYTEFGFSEVGKADALDRYLDGEISRDSAAFRAAFVRREFRERLAEMEEVLGDLSRPVRGPDLTDAILSGVDERRPFVARRTRRFITVGRLAAAACVLLATGVAVMVERARPGALHLIEEPTPVAAAVQAAGLARPAPAPRGAPRPAESALLRATLARFAHITDVEVRHSTTTDCIALTRPEGWAAGSVPTVTTAWDRGLWRIPDPTITESAGLATFPVLDGERRAWFAAR
jgi:hypothetical protein